VEGHRSSSRCLRATLRPRHRLRRRRVETMAIGYVDRAARSEGPSLASHATPHGKVVKGAPPPELLEHPMVADSG